ncbi:hypothetical protein LCGC14_2547160 [marine sediment metagenome]|uniref:Helix-turn-helix domain-containing protein n=1 Tax=marine sediment metagenome TaxID=412755 RepID=A0A0F9API2_9ZZZZ
MGRHPKLDVRRIRAEWVYVGRREAAVLGGVSTNTVDRWVASGELGRALVPSKGVGGRPRLVYCLSDVLALAENRRR